MRTRTIVIHSLSPRVIPPDPPAPNSHSDGALCRAWHLDVAVSACIRTNACVGVMENICLCADVSAYFCACSCVDMYVGRLCMHLHFVTCKHKHIYTCISAVILSCMCLSVCFEFKKKIFLKLIIFTYMHTHAGVVDGHDCRSLPSLGHTADVRVQREVRAVRRLEAARDSMLLTLKQILFDCRIVLCMYLFSHMFMCCAVLTRTADCRVRAREDMRAYHEAQAREKRKAEVETIMLTIALTIP